MWTASHAEEWRNQIVYLPFRRSWVPGESSVKRLAATVRVPPPLPVTEVSQDVTGSRNVEVSDSELGQLVLDGGGVGVGALLVGMPDRGNRANPQLDGVEEEVEC